MAVRTADIVVRMDHTTNTPTNCPPPRRDHRADYIDARDALRFRAMCERAKWFVLREFDRTLAEMGGDPWQFRGADERSNPPRNPYPHPLAVPNPFDRYAEQVAASGMPVAIHAEIYSGRDDRANYYDPPFPTIPGRPVYGGEHYDDDVSARQDRARRTERGNWAG